MIAPLVDLYIATLLVSLRVGPTFAFAPPFTLFRLPVLVRVLLSLALAFWLVTTLSAEELAVDRSVLGVLMLAELLTGVILALGLQLAFAAIMFVGRAIDFQAGFSLALLADPSLQTRMPLIGSFFAYGAAMVFFAGGGGLELLALWDRSLDALPLGAMGLQLNVVAVLEFMSAVFVSAVGLAGLVLLSLFMIDLTVGFLSRTLPQMNVLLLGFQVKSIAILILLPIVLSASGVVFLRLMVAALSASSQFV